jgi:hypothetical protein
MARCKHLLRRIEEERGQAIVFSAITLTVLLGMAAVVLDVGQAYLGQRSLQASADAAALAGAQALPSPTNATTLARQYSGEAGRKNAHKNLPAVASTITTECRTGMPCSPVNAVVVVQRAKVPTNFARVFGIDSLDVKARAVAMVRDGDTPWAVFAYDSACGGLVLKSNLNNLTVEGAMRSNGALEVNGENIFAEYTSSGGPSTCAAVVNGKNIDLGGGSSQPVMDSRLLPWPRYFTTSEFTCTYTRDKFTFNTTGQTIPTGTYCGNVFEANGNDIKGTITVLANEIKINGNNHSYKPHQKDVLFFATGTKEMVVNGESAEWEGVLFHPNGRIKINGENGSSLRGLIEGLEVEVNGNGFHVHGTGPATGGRLIALVE